MSSLLATQLRSNSLINGFVLRWRRLLSLDVPFRALFTPDRHDEPNEPVDNYDQFSVKFYPISLYLYVY
jgi:hypothetical protein